MFFVGCRHRRYYRPLKKLFFFAIFCLVLFNLDWWTKVWVFDHKTSHPVLIPGFLRVNYEPNDQAAFGIPIPFAGITTMSLLVIAGGVGWFCLVPLQFMSSVLLLMVSGAAGNLLTRFWVARHAEVDFLEFTWAHNWSRTCNIADLYIFLALLTLVGYGLKSILVKPK